MPSLQEIKMTPLPSVLKTPKAKLYCFKDYRGVAILRINRTEFWVHDVVHQVGVIVSDFMQAKEVLKELAQDF